MLLTKEFKPVDYHTVPVVPLTQFNDPDIAFVVGIIHRKYKSYCVTKAGGFYASTQTPEQLCRILDAAWTRYDLWTHHDVHTSWVNLQADASAAVQAQLKKFQGAMRVASCGKRSFWSPRPYAKTGLWFFTPACQDIVIHQKFVQFTTHAHGQDIHWQAALEDDANLPITPATLAVLMRFVEQKAAIVQAFAHQEATEILHDQEITVPGYDFTKTQLRYPIGAELFRTDANFLGRKLLGERYLDATKARVYQLVDWVSEKDDES